MAKLNFRDEIFSRGVADIVTREEFARRLDSGKRLRIKHGIDATAPELHIGHAASLWKIRALQERGHKAVILFGDVTTAIGDPTGRSRARPVLSHATIRSNIRAIEKQVRRILLTGPKVYEARRSSEWYTKMSTPDFLRLLSLVTHARLIERDMFRERLKAEAKIFMHELIYPILQGYDSVKLRADITIIGHDQLFNEHMGRFLQEKFGQSPQTIVALSILSGLDGGDKMSKSLGNYIGLLDPPQDKFGKTMRIRDQLIIPYLENYTDISFPRIRQLEKELDAGGNPMKAKLFLAEELVRMYHGRAAAEKEKERFLSIFSRGEVPKDAPSVKIIHAPRLIIDLLVELGLTSSKSEARRLVIGGAVEIDGTTVRSPKDVLKVVGGELVRVGKRKILRIK